jgi:hypothetical protein
MIILCNSLLKLNLRQFFSVTWRCRNRLSEKRTGAACIIPPNVSLSGFSEFSRPETIGSIRPHVFTMSLAARARVGGAFASRATGKPGEQPPLIVQEPELTLPPLKVGFSVQRQQPGVPGLRGYPAIGKSRKLLSFQEVRRTHSHKDMPRCVSPTPPTSPTSSGRSSSP